MSQGNPSKVNSIVNIIVEKNAVLKLKTTEEQDNSKESIEKTINSALSKLNEVGKELVLKDLEVDPEEKFKVFIDDVGNIDVPGLKVFTTTIVDKKIEEANREGIDLRKEATQVFKNDKISVAEGVLTVAVIDIMIRDFDKLSSKDIQTLANNWLNMTTPQKFAYREALGKTLYKKADIIDDEEVRNQVKNQAKVAQKSKESFEDALERFRKQDNEEKVKFLENILGRKLSPEEELDLETTYTDMWLEQENKLNKKQAKLNSDCDELETQKNKSESNINKEKIISEKIRSNSEDISRETLKRYFIELPQIGISLKEFEKLPLEQQQSLILKYNPKCIPVISSSKSVDLEKQINKIPIALAKAGISQEQIKEALTQYKNYFENLETDDVAFLAEQKDEERASILAEEFEGIESNEQTSQILKMMANITFDGKFKEILENPEMFKEFFAQFEQVISQDISQDKDAVLTGELGEIFSKFFEENAVDMDVSAIETEKQQTTEETEQVSVENIDSILEQELTDEERAELEAKDYFGEDFITKFEDLKEKLAKSNVQLRIHGTSDKETAENIEKDGLLIYGSPTLKMTSYSYSSYSSMQHWPHKDSKYLVLIGVPTEATKDGIYDENGNLTLDSESFESKPLFTIEENAMTNKDKASYRLPSEFIVGYVNVENKDILLNPQYKSEHTYEDLYVGDSELGKSPEVDLSLFGEESELGEWLEDFADIDNQVTPEDRKKATEVITHTKENIQEAKDEENFLSEDNWKDGWD